MPTAFTDPNASDKLNAPSHSSQHRLLNHAVNAIEASVLTMTFGYGDATPEAIGEAVLNKQVLSVEIHITIAFDGIGAALAVGDVGVTDRLMLASQNDPASVGVYETHPVFAYTDPAPGTNRVTLAIAPGAGATQGAGLVVVRFQV